MIDVSFDWGWTARNWTDGMKIGALLLEHIALSIIPVLIAVIISIPLGYLVFLTGKAANGMLAVLGVIYSVPSLALFVALPAMIGTSILSPVNVAVALAIYSIALLVRNVVDGLRSVPGTVKQSASAIGYGWFRRLLVIELPLALPVIFAGLRVVTVSNIAMVSVAAVVGGGALGQLFDRGLNSSFLTPIIVGLALSLILALIADALILLIKHQTLPWARGRRLA
ncbi:ABC transporter permease [Microlunatus parietis]|uniref:Osmoprotectant transport system permease protein n=1 Tax=Microlunatus parietis TaxID=682979 RepID=A0A7Y9IAP9_9ACTN|nr:ABC transporter permease [Microlunatus parietis]NYE73451.1 osmoprotectant transport system permease protein [Microlunatus parietis]